ncbi:MAG TPA: tRNA (5-methylaminomethyl-2-thiouridine)(34)-methyltransferase MnmD [Caulobacteraceae bacterium]|nr:tRNA (5-methylaminomethyl-2-thiouridine)(34)-methyltransferase MnmD [Caulobacteraceae bacterium]
MALDQKGPRPSLTTWDDRDVPRSRLYDDIYFSGDDGLAESRAVFLAGCGLPEAWRGRRAFRVAELGFGAGLNIAALLCEWRRTREPGARLSIFSVEAHPLSAAEAGRALGRWPEIGAAAALLASRWPGKARGFHRLDLPEFAATLDVAIMPATQALAAWSGPADAWFLDGFSPARNPRMWDGELLELVARRSAPGARAASFTVAGQVRRDLAATGFSVERRPGFGAKRQRLEAIFPGRADPSKAPPSVAIVGAGIAGASLARAFGERGALVTVFDAGRGAGASGGAAALISPRLDAGLGPAAELFAQAARRAAGLCGAVSGGVIAHGALQLETGPKDAGRFEAIARSDMFEPGAMRRLTAMEVAQRLGEAAPAGLSIAGAVVAAPEPVLAAWLKAVTPGRVGSVEPAGDGRWRLVGESGESLIEADVVCLAAGMACAELAPGVPLSPVRGQASGSAVGPWPMATVFGGYVIPARQGLVFGATHDRDDTAADVRPADQARNLETVAQTLPVLAERLRRSPATARAAIRATTRDYLPIAGVAPGGRAGLFVLTGLGSRGFTLAPLLAEHVAALALGDPSPLPRALAALLDPDRFARRARRRLGEDAAPV